MPPVIKRELCDGCGICYNICPEDVFRMEDGGVEITYPDECWHCGACMIDCPSGAIEMYIPVPMRLFVKKKGLDGKNSG